jgi:nucleotide-binding universal stress UspA family protein
MSYKLKRILAPTDFSELSGEAARLAARIAAQNDAELVLFYADPFLPPPHFLGSDVGDVAASLANSKTLAEEELEKLRAEVVPATVRSRSVVIEDLPVAAIVDWSNRNEVDLVVMGTHGRSGINRIMLGSVSERVLREGSVPLLLVRPHQSAEIRTIVCPVNLSPIAQRTLEYAAGFATAAGAQLALWHVPESHEPEGESIEQWIPPQLREKVTFHRLEQGGDPAEHLIHAAREEGADLIIIGAQHRRFVDTTVIGSTTVKITRHAPCPVLVVTARDEKA